MPTHKWSSIKHKKDAPLPGMHNVGEQRGKDGERLIGESYLEHRQDNPDQTEGGK